MQPDIRVQSYPNSEVMKCLQNGRSPYTEELSQQLANGTDPADRRNQAKTAKRLARLNKERINDGLPILDSFADITRKWLGSCPPDYADHTLKKNKPH